MDLVVTLEVACHACLPRCWRTKNDYFHWEQIPRCLVLLDDRLRDVPKRQVIVPAYAVNDVHGIDVQVYVHVLVCLPRNRRYYANLLLGYVLYLASGQDPADFLYRLESLISNADLETSFFLLELCFTPRRTPMHTRVCIIEKAMQGC